MFNLKKKIYADTSSATPLSIDVEKAMRPYYRKYFANPGSIHKDGVFALNALASSRKKIADILNAHSDEIVFTSSGTEGNNLAITGVVKKIGKENKFRPHILVSAIEHSSILEQEKVAKEFGFDWEILPVNKDGFVEGDVLKEKLRPETVLVSVHLANNEIGTIQDVVLLRKIIRNFEKNNILANRTKKIIFHTDACQAPRFLDMSVNKLGVDLMTLNSGKIYGPKGVGCLYVRRGTEIDPIILGGGQEDSLRSGTENIPGIVGFALALEICYKNRTKETEKLKIIRDKLKETISKNITGLSFNGSFDHRLPHNLNISFNDVSSEELVLWLDAKGISVSSGSACGSHTKDESYVILALNKTNKEAGEAIRITLGRDANLRDVNKISKAIISSVKKIRESKKLLK